MHRIAHVGRPRSLGASGRHRRLDETRTERVPEGGLGDANPCAPLTDVPGEAAEAPVIELGDLKPGDVGEIRFSFALRSNPGRVCLTGGQEDKSESGMTEPELDTTGEQDGVVELQDASRVGFWHDEDCDNDPERNRDAEQPVDGGFSTLRHMPDNFEAANKVLLDGDRCYAADEPTVSPSADGSQLTSATRYRAIQ